MVENLCMEVEKGGSKNSNDRASNGVSLKKESNGHMEEANGEVPDGIYEMNYMRMMT